MAENGAILGTVMVANTIIAGNSAGTGPDVSGTVTSNGYNLVGDGSGSSGFDTTGDQVGTSANPLNPGLGSVLLDNGGLTPTLALGPGPAVDTGAIETDPNTNQQILTDQRGFNRPVGPAPDIGAYEYQPPATTTTLTVSLPNSTAVYAGQPVTMTANVIGNATNSNTPAGSVDFFDTTTNTDLGTAALVNGVAGLVTTSLAAGPNSITATYEGFTEGDYQFSPSSSSPVTATMTALPPGIFSKAASGVAQSTGSAMVTAAATNQTVSATLSPGANNGQEAGIWVADYNANPNNNGSGTISIATSSRPATGLAFYDVQSTGVVSNNASATLQVSFTFSLPNVEETAYLVLAYWDPSSSAWIDVNAPGISNGVPASGAESVTQLANGSALVTIVTTLSSTTTPTIDDLTGTVITAALTTPVITVIGTGDGPGVLTQAGFATFTDTTLRGAINEANAIPGSIIAFNIPTADPGYNSGGGTFTIAPQSSLPALTEPTTLDATTEPGFAGTPIIVLSGVGSALTVSGGAIVVSGFSLTTSTDDPTILVTGGSLTLRNDVVQGSTGYSAPAIAVTGGTVDLGTSATPGGNVLNANGTAWFLNNQTSNPIPEVGETFEVNGVPTGPLVLDFNSLTVAGSNGAIVSNSGTWSDTAAGASVTLTASLGTITQNPDGTWTWAYTTPAGSPPATSVVINATDSQSNTATAIFALNVNNVFTVTNTLDDGSVGSLPWAINQVNSDPSDSPTQPDLIDFNIPWNDPGHVYYRGQVNLADVTPVPANTTSDADLANASLVGSGNTIATAWPYSWWTIDLPYTENLTQPVILNGYSQPGSSPNTSATGDNAVLRIDITPSEAGGDWFSTADVAFSIPASNSTVTGIVFNGFDAPDPSSTQHFVGAVFNDYGPTQDDIFAGNFFGTDVSGTLAVPNWTAIWLAGGAQGNRIGMNSPQDYADRNILSGNAFDAVTIVGSGTEDNVITGNLIGTDRYGNPLGNGLQGVFVGWGATSNQIGGSGGLGNVIAYNGGNAQFWGSQVGGPGVAVGDANFTQSASALGPSEGNSIEGNAIYGNAGLGIDLSSSAWDTTGAITGIAQSIVNSPTWLAEAANDSQGHSGPNNWQNFPVLTSASSSSTSTSASGTFSEAAEPNTTITLDFYANPAADPSGYGQGKTWLGSTTVTTDKNGNASFTASLAVGNVGGQWIAATATDPMGNTSEFSVDLAVGSHLSLTVNQLTVSGQSGSTVSNSGTWSDTAPGAAVTLAASVGTVTGNGNGTWSWSYTTPAGSPSSASAVISASDGLGNSAISVFQLRAYQVYTVTTGLDDGNDASPTPGSLRAAILASNQTAGAGGPNLITFNIPTTDPSYDPSTGSFDVLAPIPGLANIPNLPDLTAPVVIDGYTQPGAHVNTLAKGDNAVLKIVLNGTPVVPDYTEQLLFNAGNGPVGLNVLGGDTTVRGLVINNFAYGYNNGHIDVGAWNDTGIEISSDNNIIEGNFIGTDSTGELAQGNGGPGVQAFDNSAYNRIGMEGDGADDFADRNIISANGIPALVSNGNAGIRLDTTSYTVVAGNYIGTDASGTQDIDADGRSLGNSIYGVLVEDIFESPASSHNQIGGNGPGDVTDGNLISGNAYDGVSLGYDESYNSLFGNGIGTDATGTRNLGNGQNGVLAFSTRGLAIAGNVIAYNGKFGVALPQATTGLYFGGVFQPDSPASGVRIEDNSIHDNKALGIDLGGTVDIGDSDPDLFTLIPPFPEVLLNDSQGHTGPNNFQDYPILDSAVSSSTDTSISGFLSSGYVSGQPFEPNEPITLDFYANAEPDPSGYGQGQIWLGSTTVTTDANGNAAFTADLAVGNLAGQWISATATDPSGDTSEFSADVQATALTVSAGGPYTSTEDNGVTFTASTSPGTSGYALSYAWTVNGYSVVGDNNGASPTLTLTWPQLEALGIEDGPATFTVQVAVNDGHGLTASSPDTTLTLNDAPVSNLQVALQSSSISEGGSANLSGSFVNPSPLDANTVVINWGDGSPNTTLNLAAGVTAFSGILHPYTEESAGQPNGSYPITVTVSDNEGNTTTATTSIQVNDAPLTAGTASATASTEGVSSSTLSASFTDANTAAPASDFTATITWGDGRTSAGTVTGSGRSYTISATHLYAEERTYSIGISVVDDGGSTTALTTTATVADAPLTAGTASTTASTEGVSSSTLSASFTDANTAAPASDFTATITWGDGHTSAGTVTGSGGSYTISATHSYTEEGTYSIAISVVDDGGSTTALATTATVADAPLTAAGTTLTPLTATAFTGVVASFTDADPGGTVSDYTASIAWGDSQTSAGTIAANGQGGFNVTGTHTYAADGVYTVSISIKDAGGASASPTSTAYVGGPATKLSVTAATAETAGTPFSLTVKALDAKGNRAYSYAGTVHFTSSDAQAVLPANYTFNVGDLGSHVFSVTLKTAGTQSVTATDTVTGSITGKQTGIVVSPAAASQLVITQQPSATATAGAAFATQPVVKEEDPFGNVITSDSTHTVTAARGGLGTDVLHGTTTVTLASGVAKFSGLFYDKAETMDIAFSTNASGVSSATSTSIAVSPAKASQLLIHREPSPTATVGQPFPTQPVIYEEDAYGNLETGDNSTQVKAALNTGTGTLLGTTTITVSGGVATFTNLAYNKAQTISLKFTSGKLTAALSTNIVVSSGAAPAALQPAAVAGGTALSATVAASAASSAVPLTLLSAAGLLGSRQAMAVPAAGPGTGGTPPAGETSPGSQPALAAPAVDRLFQANSPAPGTEGGLHPWLGGRHRGGDLGALLVGSLDEPLSSAVESTPRLFEALSGSQRR